MINLSNKSAKRFGISWKDLEERAGDFWKVDVVMVERVPMLFIVHEHYCPNVSRIILAGYRWQQSDFCSLNQ
jgi:hypothetical protein